jgi:hypothetical protein
MGRKTFRTNKKGIGEFLDQLLTKKMDLQEVGWGGAWTGLIWLRVGTGGGLL